MRMRTKSVSVLAGLFAVVLVSTILAADWNSCADDLDRFVEQRTKRRKKPTRSNQKLRSSRTVSIIRTFMTFGVIAVVVKPGTTGAQCAT